MTYVERVLEKLKQNNPGESEFHQAATEILLSLQSVIDQHPEYEKAGLLERFVEPERVVLFRVPWVDDQGNVSASRYDYLFDLERIAFFFHCFRRDIDKPVTGCLRTQKRAAVGKTSAR